MRRRLARLGCTFREGKKHLIIYYKGARSVIPHHPAREAKAGTCRSILKDLGIGEL